MSEVHASFQLTSLISGTLLCASACAIIDARADVVLEPVRRFGFGSLEQLALSPDGTRMATAGRAGAFLWDFAGSVMEHRLEQHHSAVWAMGFSPDGEWLVTSGGDLRLRAFDAHSGVEIVSFSGHASDVRTLSFAPDGKSFISASSDGTARAWSMKNGEPLFAIEAPGSWMAAAAFLPDGKHLVTAEGFQTNRIRLWNVEGKEPVPLHDFIGHELNVIGMAVLPGGNFATAAGDRTVRIWNWATGEEIHQFKTPREIFSVIASSDGAIIGAVLPERVIAWNSETGEEVSDLSAPGLASAIFVPGRQQLLAAHADHFLRIWDLQSETAVKAIEGHNDSFIAQLSFSPDGRLVASAGLEPAVRVWDGAGGTQVENMPVGLSGSRCAIWSVDGAQLLSTRSSPDHALVLRNAETGAIEREFSGHTSFIMSAAFSLDGTRAASASVDKTARFWDTATGAELRVFSGNAAGQWSVAISPDTQFVATGSEDGTARIWSVETGAFTQWVEPNAGRIEDVAFSPDGTELMTASESGLVVIWDTATGEQKRQIGEPHAFLHAAAWSRDGRFILTGEGFPFFEAHLWDARTGEQLRTFGGHAGAVESLAFSVFGGSVVTGAEILGLWDISDITSRLQIEQTPEGAALWWGNGTLQSAPAVSGGWADEPGAGSPRIIDTREPSRFFRVRRNLEP